MHEVTIRLQFVNIQLNLIQSWDSQFPDMYFEMGFFGITVHTRTRIIKNAMLFDL